MAIQVQGKEVCRGRQKPSGKMTLAGSNPQDESLLCTGSSSMKCPPLKHVVVSLKGTKLFPFSLEGFIIDNNRLLMSCWREVHGDAVKAADAGAGIAPQRKTASLAFLVF